MPFAWFTEVFEHDGLWTSGFDAWIGYRNGEPVTSAAVVANDETLGIYNVATLPQFRGKGYAEAAVRHAVEQAGAAGARRIVLQSTAPGYPLYVRMGFCPVARFTIFATR